MGQIKTLTIVTASFESDQRSSPSTIQRHRSPLHTFRDQFHFTLQLQKLWKIFGAFMHPLEQRSNLFVNIPNLNWNLGLIHFRQDFFGILTVDR
jgi:hypothetical protein